MPESRKSTAKASASALVGDNVSTTPTLPAFSPAVSVIIPVHNEAGAITSVLDELDQILPGISSRYQVLIVDDGSTDGTPELLVGLTASRPNLAVLQLVRRVGKATAVQAGIDSIPAWADIVVMMDGDGQDDPHDLPAMFAPLIHNTADMVLGWRQERAESILRVFPSRVANKMLARATGVPIHDFGSPLKVMRADLAKTLQLRGDMHRFIPALGALSGARMVEYPVVQRKRESGHSKYGFGRTITVFLDMIGLYFILRYSDRPIRLFGAIALWFLIIGLAIMLYLGIDRIFFNVPVLSRPFFPVAIFLLLSSVIVVMNGLTAELLSQSIFRRDQPTRSYMAKGEWGGVVTGSPEHAAASAAQAEAKAPAAAKAPVTASKAPAVAAKAPAAAKTAAVVKPAAKRTATRSTK